MSQIEFVTYCIQHDDRFPAVGEIDIVTAEKYLSFIDPNESVPKMTAPEFMSIWNELIHNPDVMTE